MAASWMDQYEHAIREKLDWIRFHRMSDTQKAHELATELIAYGRAHSDPTLIGACQYYLGELAYVKGDFSQAITDLGLSLVYLEHSPAPRLFCTGCNLLGVIHMQGHSLETSMDYFLRGLQAARENNFAFSIGLLDTNAADIYILIKEYDRALEFLRDALKNFEIEQESPDFHRHCVINNLINTANLLLFLNRLPQAKEAIDQAEEMLKDATVFTQDTSSFYLVKILMAEKERDEGKLAEYTQKYIDSFMSADGWAEMVASTNELMDYLYAHGRLDLLSRMKGVTDRILSADVPPHNRLSILRLQWQLLPDHCTPEAARLTEQMVETMADLENYSNKTTSAAIASLVTRSEQFGDARKWMMMASKDTLTSLWNRRHFDTLFQQKAADAVENQLPLAVGIMDIDYFKEFNDYYGHLTGDECLKSVAELLLSFSSDQVQFARYGGDEFLLLAVGMEQDELTQVLDKLYARLAELNIPHANSTAADHVTLSMGIAVHDPAIADLGICIEAADFLLYKAKGLGKNKYILEARGE